MCVYVFGHRDIFLKLHVWIPHGKMANAYFWFSLAELKIKIKIKKLCLTSHFETDNISSVELLLQHNK